MRYLIDGYNLIHAMGLLHGSGAPGELANARFGLLDRLAGYFGDNAQDLTVVFDAGRVPRRSVASHDYRGLHVRFAEHAEADDLIEALIQSEQSPPNLTIVSDDHRIQVAAQRRQCVVLGCDAFLDVAERQGRPQMGRPNDSPSKPQSMSAEERQHWLDEFADLDDDPALRHWPDASSFEIDE
jgi:predicted RNA-binding protein with PIN domain